MSYYLGVSKTRSYDDPCGTARALDAIGERWALLVVRELMFGPKRFTDLNRGLAAMSQNVLSQRLRDLEEAGVVRQRKLGPPAGIRVYELTGRGRELEPVLIALGRWGSRTPLGATTAELSIDALMLALKTTFAPGIAGDLRAAYQLRIGDDRFHAKIAEGRLELARGEIGDPDAVIEADVPTLRALVFARRPLADAVHAGEAVIEGDRRAAEHLLRCFPRPEPFGTEKTHSA